MITVTRTEQIQFTSKSIGRLCHASKNLYNAVNFVIRQRFFENEKLYKDTKQKTVGIFYEDLLKMFRDTEVYKSLPAATSQHVIKYISDAWKSYFRHHKRWLSEYLKEPWKFPNRDGEPKIPKYKHKNGEYILIFTNQQCRIVNGILQFPRMLELELKTRLLDANIKRKKIKNTDLREVRIIPNHINYICEIVYNKEINHDITQPRRIIGIDPGISNIIAIANNIGEESIIVKGGVAKSMNQFYNKERARLKSIYDKAGIKYGGKLRRLDWKRRNKIKDYSHKLSRMVINYAIKNNIDTIVVGKNPFWKDGINLGKRNNQQFCEFPHAKLIKMIQYKADEVGISVILQEESHTSKCSFLDNESVEHHEKYVGNRGKSGKKKKRYFKTRTGKKIPADRGLFMSAAGIIIHADINGALNIIRKAVPNAFANGIEDVWLHPKRYYV
jgi:putative transposase